MNNLTIVFVLFITFILLFIVSSVLITIFFHLLNAKKYKNVEFIYQGRLSDNCDTLNTSYLKLTNSIKDNIGE